MEFIIGLLLGCVLLSIRPVLGYYHYKPRFEQSERDFKRLSDKCQELTAELAEAKSVFEKAKQENVRLLTQKQEFQQKASKFEELYTEELAESAQFIAEMTDDMKLHQDEYHAQKRQLDSLTDAFNAVRKTLSPDQRALIQYPSVNPAQVYRTPAGHSYHSVSWCHTISGRYIPLTLEEAKKAHYSPCSICVKHEKPELPKQLEFFYESH